MQLFSKFHGGIWPRIPTVAERAQDALADANENGFTTLDTVEQKFTAKVILALREKQAAEEEAKKPKRRSNMGLIKSHSRTLTAKPGSRTPMTQSMKTLTMK